MPVFYNKVSHEYEKIKPKGGNINMEIIIESTGNGYILTNRSNAAVRGTIKLVFTEPEAMLAEVRKWIVQEVR